MIAADLVRFGVFALLPFVDSAATIVALAAVAGIAGGFFMPAATAGLPNLVLRVPGRKSGVVRSTPLLCVPRSDDWLIAGSYFGNPKTPAWVHNLRATETAEIVRDGTTVTVRWRELEGDERSRAWQALLETWPNFRLYEQRTDRLIPVFSLTAAV